MIVSKNHTSGIAQGASPAKTKRLPLKFITFNEDGKATLLNGTQIVNLLGMYFVKMPLQDAFFKILDDGGIDFKNPISESMMVVALQDLGVKNMAVAKNYLKCETIKEISPLSIVYNYIRKTEWDGRDRISEAIDAMNLKGKKFANNQLIRKWYLNTYSLAFNHIDPKIDWTPEARCVLILYSDARGWGKSAILNFLGLEGILKKIVPSIETEVCTVLRGEIPKDDWTINNLLTTNMIINVDDLQNLLCSASNDVRARLRALCTATTSSQRKMRSEKIRTKARRANICGSTNNKYAIRDNDENRYMMFELDKKVKDLREYGDDFIEQFWAQVRSEAIEERGNCNWDSADYDLIVEMNKPYLFKSPLEMEIEDRFIFSEYAEELTFNEIKAIIGNDFAPLDLELRTALLRLVPSGKDLYGRRTGRKRYINIKANDGDDNVISAGDGLPF